MSFPRYPKYKDSGVEWLGEVPEGWHVTALKRGFEVTLGKMLQPEASSSNDELLPYLRAANIQWMGVDTLDIKLMWFSERDRRQLRLISGDLLISEGGDVGRSCIWASELEECYFQNSVNRVRAFDQNSNRYLYYWISTIKSKGYIDILCNKSTIAHFTAEKVAAVPVPFPTPHEQQTIATFLDRETAKIDALVAEQENLIALLKEKRQAVISHAVTKGLDPTVPMKDSGFEWLGEVPAHWVILRLRNTANIVRGASPRPAGDPRFFSEEKETSEYIPWLTVAEITKDQLSHVDSTEKYLTPYGVEQSQTFLEGTLVLSNSGATLGVPKILGMTCCANDGVLAFRSLASRVNIMFAYYFLMSLTERLREYMKNGAQPNLNTDLVKGIAFSLPDPFEQLEIVAFLDTEIAKLDTLTAEAQRAIDLLKERRSALISAAVTGKIDVRGYRAQPPPII